MSEFKFQGQNFKMESSAKNFLEKYISRIKKYAELHKISEDLVDDIQQSILEKLLDEKGEITQKDLVKIVNSIGEPEDIFAEDAEISATSPSTKDNSLKYKALLLGVCAWLAELMKIPVRILRLLFIFLIFGYTFGIRLYLIIFLIRFVTDREKASSSVSLGVKKIISRFGDRVRRLWKNIGILIKWAWRLFVCGVLVICIGMTCAGIGFMISDLTLENQSFKMMFSTGSLIALGCLILSFSFWFIAWIFRMKGTPIKNRFAHFMALIIAIAGCIWLGAEGIGYIGMQRYNYNFPIEFGNIPPSGKISIETMDRIDGNKPKIYYELYRGDEFKAELEYSFSAKNGEIAQEIYQKANMPRVSTNEKGRVIGWGENNNLYNEVVPYNNPSIIMKITLPAGYQLDLNRSLSNRCPYGKYVYFDEERQNFLCEGEDIAGESISQVQELREPELVTDVAVKSACREDFQNFAKVVHPEKGVEIFPYLYLVSLNGTKLMQSDFSSYNGKVYDWNTVDHEGNPLKLTLNKYFDRFVCYEDFDDGFETTAQVIDGDDLMLRSDNLSRDLSFLVQRYTNSVVVKYTHIDDLDEDVLDDNDNKYSDLIFVVEPYGNTRKVVAVIHG